MSFDAKRLYELLPTIYRVRDADQGEPLEALMAVIAEQTGILEENLEQLYDDQFIETCADWVVALHRRPDRLSPAARRRAENRQPARRGGATRSRSDDAKARRPARTTGARRDRLAGARRRMLPVARLDAAHEPRPKRGILRAESARLGSAASSQYAV